MTPLTKVPAQVLPDIRSPSVAGSGRQAATTSRVWQTAINPVIALELMAGDVWTGSGVLGPEALPPRPFLDLLTAYGSPWGLREEN
ncbi:hypothetical protein SSPS47_31000 [Streptomyces sp. S4.7]|nr:hypothetical protein SSPS47_31000 [Streptomyces sp. S4.7]